MIVVFSSCHKDYDNCLDLLKWCAELDTYPNNQALVVLSTQITTDQAEALIKTAQKSFSKVTAIKQKIEEEGGWPISCNRLFQVAAQYVEDAAQQPFLWLESDAVPLKAGWLNALEQEYKAGDKPFMGAVYDWVSATTKLPHLTGVAVYPAHIKRINPHILHASTVPWDCTRPDLTLPKTHQTKLFQHMWGDRATNEAPTFPDMCSVMDLSPDAVIFHRCKDGTLIRRLREARGLLVAEKPVEHKKPEHITPARNIRHGLDTLMHGARRFSHAGNLGDVIYALQAIKSFGGGDLIISPEQRGTPPCLVPINYEQFQMAKPLLECQEYLRKVEFSTTYPVGVYDLNHFRRYWVDQIVKQREGIDTLAKCHFYELGILDRFSETRPWIKVRTPIRTGKIIVHRSPRYNSQNFPWQRLVDQRKADLLFVGLPTEHAKFQRDFKCEISFWRVNDFLELARLLAGAEACVLNQSFPLSIALGLGQKVITEACPRSPDCRYVRSNVTDQFLTAPDKLNFKDL